jgi:hypothetical protein
MLSALTGSARRRISTIALSGARFAFQRMTAFDTDPDHDADVA